MSPERQVVKFAPGNHRRFQTGKIKNFVHQSVLLVGILYFRFNPFSRYLLAEGLFQKGAQVLDYGGPVFRGLRSIRKLGRSITNMGRY